MPNLKQLLSEHRENFAGIVRRTYKGHEENQIEFFKAAQEELLRGVVERVKEMKELNCKPHLSDSGENAENTEKYWARVGAESAYRHVVFDLQSTINEALKEK